jgi:uncharacterized membrane protein YidH (DUF202 family)
MSGNFRSRLGWAFGCLCVGALTLVLGGRRAASFGALWVALAAIAVLDHALTVRRVTPTVRKMLSIVLVVITVCCVAAAQLFWGR